MAGAGFCNAVLPTYWYYGTIPYKYSNDTFEIEMIITVRVVHSAGNVDPNMNAS